MAFNGDWGNKPYIGVFIDDAAATAFVTTAGWTIGDGLTYFNSTVNAPRYYGNGAWREFGSEASYYKESVEDRDLSTPPGAPATGERYIVGAGAVGDWAGQEDNIAEWNGTAWEFEVPQEGFKLWEKDDDLLLCFNGTSWVDLPSTVPHNNLNGIQGGAPGDHYHLTQAQHDDLTTGIDAGLLHHHDSQYFTETELGDQTPGTEGAALIGTSTKANLEATTGGDPILSVEDALAEIERRNPPAFSAGPGNPNGTVDGNFGDRYLDQTTDLFYSKTTGTGSTTGWVVD
jgi:hypothetical protein